MSSIEEDRDRGVFPDLTELGEDDFFDGVYVEPRNRTRIRRAERDYSYLTRTNPAGDDADAGIGGRRGDPNFLEISNTITGIGEKDESPADQGASEISLDGVLVSVLMQVDLDITRLQGDSPESAEGRKLRWALAEAKAAEAGREGQVQTLFTALSALREAAIERNMNPAEIVDHVGIFPRETLGLPSAYVLSGLAIIEGNASDGTLQVATLWHENGLVSPELDRILPVREVITAHLTPRPETPTL